MGPLFLWGQETCSQTKMDVMVTQYKNVYFKKVTCCYVDLIRMYLTNLDSFSIWIKQLGMNKPFFFLSHN